MPKTLNRVGAFNKVNHNTMKKVRLILAAGACCLAGAAVFANTAVATTYYIETSAGAKTCSTQYNSAVCPTGSATQCTVIVADVDFYITKKVDTQACAIHFRN